MRWLRRVSVMMCGVLLAGGLAQVPALAAATPPAAPSARSAGSPLSPRPPAGARPAPGPTRLPDPGKVLPSGWQHSADEAVTVSGDSVGLHVLAASEASGYAWRTVATLGDPAVETNLWIGQACVTAAGRFAVVVYAPEQADNMAGEQGVVLGRRRAECGLPSATGSAAIWLLHGLGDGSLGNVAVRQPVAAVSNRLPG